MGSNQYYKNKALGSLEGNWGTAAIATLIIALISGGVSSVVSLPFGNDFTIGMSINSIWSLLCLPLQWGFTVFFLNMARREDINYERLFDGYKDFARTFLLEFLYVIHDDWLLPPHHSRYHPFRRTGDGSLYPEG